MSIVVVDEMVDCSHKFYLFDDAQDLLSWHSKLYGHFYSVIKSANALSDLISKHDIKDELFEEEAKLIISKHQSVLVTSCSENQDHFPYVIACHIPDKALSEYQFIREECSALSGGEVVSREVYNLSDVLDDYISDSKKSIRKSNFALELFDFLVLHKLIDDGQGVYVRPDINDNPHSSAILSQYLFRDDFINSNLKVMDYWLQLHPEDRRYCRNIDSKMRKVRIESGLELSL